MKRCLDLRPSAPISGRTSRLPSQKGAHCILDRDPDGSCTSSELTEGKTPAWPEQDRARATDPTVQFWGLTPLSNGSPRCPALLQKARWQRSSASPYRRHLEKQVLSNAFLCDPWRAITRGQMAVGHEQLRMVEWRALTHYPQVRERSAEERDEIVDLLCGQVQLADLEVDVLDVVLAKVAPAVVELHHLADRALPAVVKIRRGELQVPQARHLESTVSYRAFADRD